MKKKVEIKYEWGIIWTFFRDDSWIGVIKDANEGEIIGRQFRWASSRELKQKIICQWRLKQLKK